MNVASVIRLAQEEGDEAEDERVEHDRLGQREAEPLDRGDLVTHLGLAGHRLDDLAEDEADAHARADRAEAGAHAERDGAQALRGGVTAPLRQYGKSAEVHVAPLVLRGDRAA